MVNKYELLLSNYLQVIDQKQQFLKHGTEDSDFIVSPFLELVMTWQLVDVGTSGLEKQCHSCGVSTSELQK